MSEPLVLVPGMMCDARVFGPQIDAFSTDTAVMVAPITKGERVEEIASDLLEILPPKFALAGLSMGAIVAMELLRRAPGRVTRIALISSSPLPETPAIAARRGRLPESFFVAARQRRHNHCAAWQGLRHQSHRRGNCTRNGNCERLHIIQQLRRRNATAAVRTELYLTKRN